MPQRGKRIDWFSFRTDAHSQPNSHPRVSSPANASTSSSQSPTSFPPGSIGQRQRNHSSPNASAAQRSLAHQVVAHVAAHNASLHVVAAQGAGAQDDAQGAAGMSVEALLNAPAKRNQQVLHPMKLNGAMWFSIDPEVKNTSGLLG
ncbi:unnamed protein product [Cochlearia groenlandica]